MLIYNLFPVCLFFFFPSILCNPGRDSVPQAWQIENGMANTKKDKGRKTLHMQKTKVKTTQYYQPKGQRHLKQGSTPKTDSLLAPFPKRS